MLQGVADEVGEYLCQTVAVGLERNVHHRLFPLQLHGFGTAELEEGLDACAEFVQVDCGLLDHNLSGLHTREVENLVDKTLQTVVVALDDLIELHAVFLRVGLNKHARKAFDSIQWGTDLMAHVGKEKRLHLAGLFSLQSLFLVFLQLLVGNRQLLVRKG